MCSINSFFKLILIMPIIFLITACNYTDPAGLLHSSYVSQRFYLKDSLNNFPAPRVNDEANFNFLVISDPHYYQKQYHYLKRIEQKREQYKIEFVILTGDIVHNGRAEAYQLFFSDSEKLTIPLYPLIGNHDLYNNGFEIYKNRLGRTIYDFRINDSYFVMLDNANGYLGYWQKQWLENKLSQNKAANLFLFSHFSPIDQTFPEPTVMPHPDERYALFKLCQKYQVDFFVSGHLHKNLVKRVKGVQYIVIDSIRDKGQPALWIKVRGSRIYYQLIERFFDH